MSSPHLVPTRTSLRHFLSGLFDYAGLFPPASLSMSQALREYSTNRSGPDRWMTGPFVVGISRVPKLLARLDLFQSTEPLDISLLGPPSNNFSEFSDALQQVLECVRMLTGFPIHTAMVEIRYPASESGSSEQISEILDQVGLLWTELNPAVERLYLELERRSGFAGTVALLAEQLAARSGRDPSEGARDGTAYLSRPVIGLKLRCGGENVDDYPSINELAAFLSPVIGSGVPFKATAGLHHPVRHFNKSAGVCMHGFLNLFFASVFQLSHELTAQELVPILSDEDEASFEFTETGIRWQHLSASTEMIDAIRTGLNTSIGSCSLSEPIDDLTSLNLLAPVPEDTPKDAP